MTTGFAGAGVLITGGASGLGAATARHLAATGANIVLADLQDQAGQDVAAEVGGRYVRTDVTDPDSLASAVAAAAAAERGLRLAVACAGILRGKRLVGRSGQPAPLESFWAEIQVNLVGTINTLRLAAAAMASNAPGDSGERGVCVLTSSVAAFEGQMGQVGYAASKAGVAGLVLPAARDLADLGIRVVAIAPGIFDTPMFNEAVTESAREGLLRHTLFPRRIGAPAEFAMLVEQIAANAMLNGEVIRLDGGVRMPAR
jgi:NAD(P)-dependent dehydrogenase (short-subunit alcohol dehydrogenase family)